MMNKEEFSQQLLFTIAPFYAKLRDSDCGGYYGRVDHTLCLYRKTTKNMVANSRILWFFSRLAMLYPGNGYKSYADHALEFLKSHGISKKDGSICWSVSYAGEIEDDSVKTFCQAYGVLALATYFMAFKDPQALKSARTLQSFIESNLRDSWGYRESLDEDVKTLTSLIHLLEAYTALYLADSAEDTRSLLESALSVVEDKVLKSDELHLAYGCRMEPVPNAYRSFGHEVEASFIIDEACRALGRPCLPRTIDLASRALKDGFDGTHLAYTSLDSRAVHWGQCEAMLGFMNAYSKTGDKAFLSASQSIWDYVKGHLIDTRLGGEWLYDDSDQGHDIVSPFKGPYNNGMLCMYLGV